MHDVSRCSLVLAVSNINRNFFLAAQGVAPVRSFMRGRHYLRGAQSRRQCQCATSTEIWRKARP
eukprot:3035166-Pyramimonas_sp.AAC.1